MTTGAALSAGDANTGKDEPRGSALLREHGAVIARVCMALLGDARAVERALERVAPEASTTTFEEGKDVLARLMGLARGACANQLSKLPVRTTSSWKDRQDRGNEASKAEDAKPETQRMGGAARADGRSAIARAAIGKLKPTEREAVVLHLVGRLEAAQVAEACGIDIETARARIARGVAQLVEQEKNR
jgi:RNA polymerase sigma-70 factor, ECF subfamily